MTEQRPPGGDLHERAAELIEAYSLDALDPDDAALVSAHLDEGCEDCEEQASAFRAVVDRIPLAVPLRDAGAALRRRVLAEVAASARESAPLPAQAAPAPGRFSALFAPWRPARFASMAASVAVLAVVGLVGWNVVLQGDVSDLDEKNEALLATVATVEQQQRSTDEALVEAQAEAADASARSDDLESRMTAVVSVMGDSESQSLALAATEEAPAGARGDLYVNPTDGTFLILVAGLDGDVEGGYILWIHTRDGVHALAFFYVDKFGNGVGHGTLQGDPGKALLSISHEYDGDVRAPSSAAKLERLNR